MKKALSAHNVIDAAVYFDNDKFRVGVRANNFTDKLYYKGWSTINPQQPRNFLVNVVYKF